MLVYGCVELRTILGSSHCYCEEMLNEAKPFESPHWFASLCSIVNQCSAMTKNIHDPHIALSYEETVLAKTEWLPIYPIEDRANDMHDYAILQVQCNFDLEIEMK